MAALAAIALLLAVHDAAPAGGVPVDVAFTSRADGSEQRYVLVRPPGTAAGRPADAVIALHGHGSDRWQYVRDPRDECRAVRDWAARHGLLFVSPDYRAPASWMGPKAEADLVQVIRDLRRKHGVDRVFLAGGSMGGTAALTFATLHPSLVAGVSSVNGTANMVEFEGFQKAVAASYGGSKRDVPAEYRRRSAELAPHRLSMPVGAAVGGRDETVPPGSVRRLAGRLQRLGRPVLLIDRPEGGHAATYEDTLATLEFIWREARPSRREGEGADWRRAPSGG